MSNNPDPEVTAALEGLPAGRALDLACGSGRHARWLADRGWRVTAVDRSIEPMPGVECIEADLERQEFAIALAAFDLIVCWLYWQPDLLHAIARGVRSGGVAALAGKTTGRFATSLAQYRAAFPGWAEIAASEGSARTHFIGRKVAAGS